MGRSDVTSPPSQPSVLVVGAGIAGLAAATWLVAKGYRVQILEASNRPGGRARTIERQDGSGDRADVGTQYFHTNYRRARRLIKDAGLEPQLRRIRGRTRFFDDRASGGTFVTGHRVPYISAAGFWANVSLVLSGLGRMVRNPLDPFAADHVSTIDAEPVAAKVSAGLEWDFTVRTLIAAGALVEPEGNEISYLHLIRLMRIVLVTEYLSLDCGVAGLHEALAAPLDVAYGMPVAKLIGDERVCGVITVDDTEFSADHVILATAPGAAAKLLPAGWVKERAFLDAIHHPPAVIVTLWLDGPLEAGVWSYMFPARRESLVSFCTDVAEKNPAQVPSGRAALQAWICWPAAERAQSLSDDGLVDVVVDELETSFPGLARRIEEKHVQRHAQAVPQHPPGHAQSAVRFLAAIDRREGLQICGDFLSGGYLECALWSAERAVEQISRSSKEAT